MAEHKKINADSLYGWMHRKYPIILLTLIVLAFIAPWLFTRPLGILDFTSTGQIGDTIGGLTAPFINMLTAFLIYLTFKEQIETNNITRRELDGQKLGEISRLKRVQEIVLWDLEKRIKPVALDIKNEIIAIIPQIGNPANIPLTDYVEFNKDIFKGNSLNDYFEIFKKDTHDFQQVVNIYNRVEFIYNNSPINAFASLKEERMQAAKIMFRDNEQKQAYHDGLTEKYTKTLEALVKNVDNLIARIDEILKKYRN